MQAYQSCFTMQFQELGTFYISYISFGSQQQSFQQLQELLFYISYRFITVSLTMPHNIKRTSIQSLHNNLSISNLLSMDETHRPLHDHPLIQDDRVPHDLTSLSLPPQIIIYPNKSTMPYCLSRKPVQDSKP